MVRTEVWERPITRDYLDRLLTSPQSFASVQKQYWAHFARGGQLEPEAARELAATLAKNLPAKVALTPPAGQAEFAAWLRAALQQAKAAQPPVGKALLRAALDAGPPVAHEGLAELEGCFEYRGDGDSGWAGTTQSSRLEVHGSRFTLAERERYEMGQGYDYAMASHTTGRVSVRLVAGVLVLRLEGEEQRTEWAMDGAAAAPKVRRTTREATFVRPRGPITLEKTTLIRC